MQLLSSSKLQHAATRLSAASACPVCPARHHAPSLQPALQQGWSAAAAAPCRPVHCGPGVATPATVEAGPASSALKAAKQLLQLQETNDFADLDTIVTPDVRWRQRGLLQGSTTVRGVDAVRDSLKHMHSNYQDLIYRLNMTAEEADKVVLYWTATGTNRTPVLGSGPSYRKSVFSGVSIVYLATDGRVQEVVEYRQPTHEEMVAFFNPESGPSVQQLLAKGHLYPSEEDTHQAVGSVTVDQSFAGPQVDQSWRDRAVSAATEWVETWTPGPDLEQLIREDFEEYNRYSWPDFEANVGGKAAIAERCGRSSQQVVSILDTIADSSVNLIAVHWTDVAVTLSPAQLAAPTPHPGDATSSGKGANPSAAGPHSDLPNTALPREQPAPDPLHPGSVTLTKDGHLRVKLSPANLSKASSSQDEPGPSQRPFKVRGVTLFQLDPECRMAWSITFRELTPAEQAKHLRYVPSPTGPSGGR